MTGPTEDRLDKMEARMKALEDNQLVMATGFRLVRMVMPWAVSIVAVLAAILK